MVDTFAQQECLTAPHKKNSTHPKLFSLSNVYVEVRK